MLRDISDKLKQWKNSSNRKPLILKGARQVGKTYVLKEFGRDNYAHLAYFNFDKDPKIDSIFQAQLDPAQLIRELAVYANCVIEPSKTLIFFDEIQDSPSALGSLKYFHEEANQYHILAAGSLLGIKLGQARSFPVGQVNLINMYPLTFLEFLTAGENSQKVQYLREHDLKVNIPEAIHSELVTLLKTYLFTGGMPAVVKCYWETRDLNAVREVQKDIINTHNLDFAKHAEPGEVIRINSIWESIPAQLARENRKFIFSAVRKGARAREYEVALQWLADAGLIARSWAISAPRLPLSGYQDREAFKVFIHDVGLLGAMADLPIRATVDGDRLFTEFKGALVENYAAQELTAGLEQPLHYWTSEGIAEVDFTLQINNQIVPLEIKANVDKRKKSLRAYGDKYQPDMMFRSSLMNCRQDGNIWNIPLYALFRLGGLKY